MDAMQSVLVGLAIFLLVGVIWLCQNLKRASAKVPPTPGDSEPRHNKPHQLAGAIASFVHQDKQDEGEIVTVDEGRGIYLISTPDPDPLAGFDSFAFHFVPAEDVHGVRFFR
jgi:hypothetical protein